MVWLRVVEEGVFRFDASEAQRAAAGPSLSFAVKVLHECCQLAIAVMV